MRSKVIEQAIFASERDLFHLDFIDWNRLNNYWKDPADALDAIASWLVGRATYTVLQLNLYEYPERDDWPGWDHIGKRHGEIGRLYWNRFKYKFDGDSWIAFSDQPDFAGELCFEDGHSQRFYGDVGKVSASTFMLSLKRLADHDLWISIVNPYREIVIEIPDGHFDAVGKQFDLPE